MTVFAALGSALGGGTRRALIGAGVGGGLGWLGADRNPGSAFLAGAAGGAAAGGLGVPAVRALAGNRSIAGAAGWALGSAQMRGAGRGIIGGLGWATRQAGAWGGPLGAGALRYGGAAMRGLETGAKWIGNNATLVNKWGGRALTGLGMAAGAHIGSSMVSSNRGF